MASENTFLCSTGIHKIHTGLSAYSSHYGENGTNYHYLAVTKKPVYKDTAFCSAERPFEFTRCSATHHNEDPFKLFLSSHVSDGNYC